MVTPGAIQHHIAYTAWATGRLLESVAQLSPEELTRDFGTSDRSVLGTLAHVFAADRVWLGRVEGNPPAKFLDPEKDLKMETLTTEWPAVLDRWKQLLAAAAQEQIDAAIAYKDLKGNPYQQPLWQIVLHMVNHGTHHRGQVAGFLRSMGKTPPPLDLIAYYRQIA
jgi:uncharacterized damage-inducible protein DinB